MRKNIEIWHGAKNEVEKFVLSVLDTKSSVYDMVTSGARGSISQITQMAGMKGLIQNTKGETIEFPILSCSKEGLTPSEDFITTHGSRKGLTDTALNTAKAGYLTRKLFVVAQDVLITTDDCRTKEHITMTKGGASGIEISLTKNIRGRVLAVDVATAEGTVMFKKGHLLTKGDAQKIQDKGVTAVAVRSPLTCSGPKTGRLGNRV
jgi:DNA-directed RNA polymerase subunit beta'